MAPQPRFPMVIPDLAARAYESARQGGFGKDGPTLSSRPGTGALLAVLAASWPRPGPRLGSPSSEPDWVRLRHGSHQAWTPTRAFSPSNRTKSGPERPARCSVPTGGSRSSPVAGRLVPPRGPFDLVFVDSGFSRRLDQEAAAFLLGIVAGGGMLVMDDLTPKSELRGDGADPKRAFALDNPRVIGAELYPPAPDGTLGGPQSGLLVMTKRA